MSFFLLPPSPPPPPDLDFDPIRRTSTAPPFASPDLNPYLHRTSTFPTSHPPSSLHHTKCPKCSTPVLDTPDTISSHALLCRGDFECRYCGLSRPSAEMLSEHLVTVCALRPRRHECIGSCSAPATPPATPKLGAWKSPPGTPNPNPNLTPRLGMGSRSSSRDNLSEKQVCARERAWKGFLAHVDRLDEIVLEEEIGYEKETLRVILRLGGLRWRAGVRVRREFRAV